MGGAIALPEVSTAEEQYVVGAIQSYLDVVKILFAELCGEDEEDTEMKSILDVEEKLGNYLQQVSYNTTTNFSTYADLVLSMDHHIIIYHMRDYRCSMMVGWK